MRNQILFNRICIIGVGLIGGSIARAARSKGLCKEIVAYGPNEYLDNLINAKESDVIDEFYTDIGEAVKGCDLVIIAIPVGSMESIFKKLQPYWDDKTIYMDVGSTKGSVVTALEKVFSKVPSNFILAHPIAGAEKSGVKAAKSQLFEKKRLIITPVDNVTDDNAKNKIEIFWKTIGSIVSTMSVAEHDKVLAFTSHLPHLLAFTLMPIIKNEKSEFYGPKKYNKRKEKLNTFTRIASSDTIMWRDIFVANEKEILESVSKFRCELKNIYSDKNIKKYNHDVDKIVNRSNKDFEIKYRKKSCSECNKSKKKPLSSVRNEPSKKTSKRIKVIAFSQIISNVLNNIVDKDKSYKKYAAGGFRDFSSMAVMKPRAKANIIKDDKVKNLIDEFDDALKALTSDLNSTQIVKRIEDAKKIRNELFVSKQED